MRRARRAKLAPIANSALDTHPPLPICICVLVHIWICAHIYKYMLAHTLNEYTEWLHRIVYRCTTATTPSTTVFEFATAYISFSTSHATHSLVCVRIHVLVHVLDILSTSTRTLLHRMRACMRRGPRPIARIWHRVHARRLSAACESHRVRRSLERACMRASRREANDTLARRLPRAPYPLPSRPPCGEPLEGTRGRGGGGDVCAQILARTALHSGAPLAVSLNRR